MANLPGISVSALTARNENQLALVNLNFDFSLVKLAAPEEFRPLGQALSSWRRETAESGPAHRTARKLGALFEQVVKPGDDLIKAYGQRVSEISSSQKAKPKPLYKFGLFEKHAGADGTAIWAAATSGKPAIAVILLACMLARLWDAPKATSIWSELVERRKRQITETYDGTEPSHIAPLAAAQQNITRKELAEWDSSARAWLAIADQVKGPEYQRMESVLLMLSLPVDNSSDVLLGVIRAWNTAMVTLEKLIKGMPQRIHDGAALIAISAWHIYPDVDLFGIYTKAVQQKDDLVRPGGRLTVGLEDADPGSSQGVYWSLSLANLHYYGDPVYTTNHVRDETRVSFSEITLVALGSLFAGWESPKFDAHFDYLDAANFLTALWNTLNGIRADGTASLSDDTKYLLHNIVSRGSWLSLLVSAAKTVLEEDMMQSKRAQKLGSLGVRRAVEFLQPKELRVQPFFGLSEPSVFLKMLRDDDARIGALRAIAQKMSLEKVCRKAIIRYYNNETKLIEYATALPLQHEQKRDHAGNAKFLTRHQRWIDKNSISFNQSGCLCDRVCTSECTCRLAGTLCSRACYKKIGRYEHGPCGNTRQAKIEGQGEECGEFDPDNVHYALTEQCIDWYERTDKYIASNQLLTDQEASLHNADGPLDGNLSWEEQVVDFDRSNKIRSDRYEYLLGDIDSAALFAQYENEADPVAETQEPAHKTLPDLEAVQILLSSRFSDTELINHISNVYVNNGRTTNSKGTKRTEMGPPMRPPTSDSTEIPSKFYLSMQALATAAHVYALLPDATIALRAMENRLWEAAWMPPAQSAAISGFQPRRLDLPQTFSCVAMFETGTLNIDPKELDKVFAMSSGSSIFAATPLLIDPYDVCKEYELRQIMGNVGRAGVSMLIPPANPVLRNPGMDSWQAINHDPFTLETKCLDHFDKTSLHLSFTGYEQPVASAVQHGARDTEACYLETLVSIFDGGRKIGDIDILGALKSPLLHRVRQGNGCIHGRRSERFKSRWTCIDLWNELLEMPEGKIGIVRAHQNSIARLAVAVTCIQKGLGQCHILPSVLCYFCVSEVINGRSWKEGQKVLVC